MLLGGGCPLAARPTGDHDGLTAGTDHLVAGKAAVNVSAGMSAREKQPGDSRPCQINLLLGDE
jgi:hypothetical protein